MGRITNVALKCKLKTEAITNSRESENLHESAATPVTPQLMVNIYVINLTGSVITQDISLCAHL